MFLTELKTEAEKTAFLNLAYLVAKSDGSIGYSETVLMKLFFDELALDQAGYHFVQKPANALCSIFTGHHTKEIVFANLLSLVMVGNHDKAYSRANSMCVRNKFGGSSKV